jgi:hypothetical protein
VATDLRSVAPRSAATALIQFVCQYPYLDSSFVMAGLVPAIHVFELAEGLKTWMPGTTRPGMTRRKFRRFGITPKIGGRPAGFPPSALW